MNLSNYQRTDPHLLLGLVNTELRNNASNLRDLCLTHDLDPDLLTSRLGDAGYTYQPDQNQFR